MLLSRILILTVGFSIGAFLLFTEISNADETNKEADSLILLEQAEEIKAEIDKLNLLSKSSINELESLRKNADKCATNNIKTKSFETDCYEKIIKYVDDLGAKDAFTFAFYFEKNQNITSLNIKFIRPLVNRSKQEIDNYVQSLISGKFDDQKSDRVATCNQYSERNGKLIRYSIDNKLDIKENEVLTSDNEKLNRFISSGCVFYHTYYDIEEKPSIYIPYNIFDGTPYEPILYPPFTPDLFVEQCINNMANTSYIDNLHEILKNWNDGGLLESKNKIPLENKMHCRKSAKFLCDNVYEVKGTFILSYSTVGCTIRDVTKEDVEADMQWIDTNAAKVNHSTMIDTLEACRQARENGYFWLYKKPALSKECSSSPKKKKKR